MPEFTTQTAREMQAKSVESRRQLALAAQITLDPNFVDKRLARVREQLERLDDMAASEKDPLKLDRLASAQARLATQEQQLAGRPGPGNLRPKSTRRKSRDTSGF